MRQDCYFCQIRGVEKLIAKSNPGSEKAEQFIYCAHELIGAGREKENARLSAEIHRLAKEHFDNSDLYSKEKRHANELLLSQYDYWKSRVLKSSDPFRTAAKLAVIGNIIDYGAGTVSFDISAQIEELYKLDLKVDMTKSLHSEINKAGRVLYLGDNCGEIVFDKLFIETFNHANVTYAVRGAPIINDVTLEDAIQVGLDQICPVISNGADAPSTLMEFCSEEFIEVFDKADLVISKGQGNYEGLMNNHHPNLFFMLIAKCRPMAESLGVDINDMVVTKLMN
jgi:uncharacterized protein with ATP-grasp and redox domains